MRQLVVPSCSARFYGWCALARQAFTLVLVSASACLPVRDLSDYAGTDTASPAGAASPPEPSEPAVPDAAPPSGSETPGEEEGVQGPAVALAPSTAGAPAPSPTRRSDPARSDAGASLVTRDAGPAPDAAAEAPVPVPVACALGETGGPDGRCYIFIAALRSWDAARANCQGRGPGWDLASIRSEPENAFVHWLDAGEVWVGGSDAVTDETWAWVNDGFSFWQGGGIAGQALNGAYVNWFFDEPNGAATSDCLRLLFDGSWADTECDALKASICEGPQR